MKWTASLVCLALGALAETKPNGLTEEDWGDLVTFQADQAGLLSGYPSIPSRICPNARYPIEVFFITDGGSGAEYLRVSSEEGLFAEKLKALGTDARSRSFGHVSSGFNAAGMPCTAGFSSLTSNENLWSAIEAFAYAGEGEENGTLMLDHIWDVVRNRDVFSADPETIKVVVVMTTSRTYRGELDSLNTNFCTSGHTESMSPRTVAQELYNKGIKLLVLTTTQQSEEMVDYWKMILHGTSAMVSGTQDSRVVSVGAGEEAATLSNMFDSVQSFLNWRQCVMESDISAETTTTTTTTTSSTSAASTSSTTKVTTAQEMKYWIWGVSLALGISLLILITSCTVARSLWR